MDRSLYIEYDDLFYVLYQSVVVENLELECLVVSGVTVEVQYAPPDTEPFGSKSLRLAVEEHLLVYRHTQSLVGLLAYHK